MPPVVSIIIPNFNRGAMLRETVESCLDQQGADVEVVIVDDGSSDGSALAVKTAYPQVILIEQPNQGACAARNRGLAAASGQYIKFIDSDDRLAPGVLRQQIACMQKSGADVVYGDFEFFGEMSDPRIGGKPLRITGAIVDPVDALLGDWWCAPFCYLYRRGALDSIRWNPALSCLQDFDYILRVALSGARFVYEPGIVGHYRMHQGQITDAEADKYARNRCAILDETLATLTADGVLTAQRKQLLANGYWSAARAFYRTDKVFFEVLMAKIERLTPRFMPTLWEPRSVRVLTSLLGIRRAERVFEVRRRLLGCSDVKGGS